MERLMGENATQLLVGETTRADHYLTEERVGCRVVVQQDERRAARNVKTVGGTIDGMFPAEPDDFHLLNYHLEQEVDCA